MTYSHRFIKRPFESYMNIVNIEDNDNVVASISYSSDSELMEIIKYVSTIQIESSDNREVRQARPIPRAEITESTRRPIDT